MNDIYRSQFRLPWSLYEALQEQATANGISLNAELVIRLQNSLILDTSDAQSLKALAAEVKEQRQLLAQIAETLASNPHKNEP